MDLPSSKRSREDSVFPISWSFGPDNRYLFRDAAAFNRYLKTMGRRQTTLCFFFDPQGRVEEEYLLRMREWLSFWGLEKLAGLREPFYPAVVVLFYANLQFSFDNEGHPLATSYVFGHVIDLSLPALASFLGATETLDGFTSFVHQGWPSDAYCREDYCRWFKFWPCESGSVLSTTLLPALHRLVILVLFSINLSSVT